MSIFKTNKFFRVIKHFILAIPLMFVLGVSLYTIVNPNAKDSYYGETINDEIINVVSDNRLVPNIEYTTIFNQTISLKDASSYYSNFVGITQLIDTDISVLNGITDSVIGWDFYNAGANDYNIRFHYYNSSNELAYKYFSYASSSSATNTKLVYKVLNNVTISTNYQNSTTFITYNEYSYLNNAFEYGMYQFTRVGFGQIDFVSFFNGIFMTNINNVYASFINDYINYYLFVECVFFAPWVLHAFIHFIYDMADLFRGRFNKTKEDD